jgi:hypothetical protein
VRTELLSALMCAVARGVSPSPTNAETTAPSTARATLIDVIDVLAPYDVGAKRAARV